MSPYRSVKGAVRVDPVEPIVAKEASADPRPPSRLDRSTGPCAASVRRVRRARRGDGAPAAHVPHVRRPVTFRSSPCSSGSRVSGSRGSWTSSAPKSPRSFPCTWGDASLAGRRSRTGHCRKSFARPPTSARSAPRRPARDSNGPSRPSSTPPHRHALARAIGLEDGVASGGDSVVTGVEAVARLGPLWLIFDDLQWAEPPLIDLIEHIAASAQTAPILIVGLARPELLEVRRSSAMP